METNSDVTIRVGSAADQESIILFLRKFFFRDEPLSECLKLATDKNPICENWERFTLQTCTSHLNIIAEHEGNIIGVCLNVLTEKGSTPEKFICTDNKFQKLIQFLEDIEKQADYFGKYPGIERLLTVLILSVDPGYRRKGIGKKLVERARKLAKEHKAGIIAVECTSTYTALASRSLGFDEIFSMDYTDYKKNGKIVFNPLPSHKTCKIYISKIL